VTDADYFQLHTEPTPFHLVLVDEVVNGHPMLHRKVFEILIELFDRDYGDLNHLMQLELRKTLIDRMIHLMSKGYAIPVIDFIHHKWTCQDADMSLIRYFVVETLDIIAPPYSESFAAAFLPLVEDKMILLGSEMTEERQTAVQEFLQHCK